MLGCLEPMDSSDEQGALRIQIPALLEGLDALGIRLAAVEAALKAIDEDKPEVRVAAVEARVAAVEALIVSEQGRVEAHEVAPMPSKKVEHENCPDDQLFRDAQKQQDGLSVRPSIISRSLEAKAMQLEAEFMFEPSAWEAAIFIGLVPVKGSVLLCIALITNICIQLLLSVIINRSFPSSPLNLEAMEQWRHFTGHYISQVDAFGYSLVSKICGSHPTLSVATSQNEILESSRTYMNADFDGPALCVIVIMIHCMFWLKDTERTLNIMKELWHLSLAARTRISLSSDETFFLESLSLARKLFMYLVCLARIAVATMLLLRGTLWLVYTISITDLVLNAVALEFVFDLDELLFEVCATKTVFLMIEQTRSQASRGAGQPPLLRGMLAPLRVSSLVAFALAVFFLYVYPNVLVLKGILEVTCDDERNFAVAHHQDLDIVFYTSTNPISTDTNQFNAIGEVTDGLIRGEIVSAAKLPDLAGMSSVLTKGATEFADEVMVGCKDSTPSSHPQLWQKIQRDFNLPGRLSCEDVSKLCVSPSLHLVRLLCPGTCRCYYPKPSIAISKGCPFWKCQDNPATAGYYDESLSCIDESVDFLATDMYWQSFWESFNASIFHASSSLQGSADYRYWQMFWMNLNASKRLGRSADVGEVVDYAMRSGCSVISKYHLFDVFCGQVADRHSLGTFCPETCDCRNQDFWGCPSHCVL